MARLIDRPGMTSAVSRGHNTTTQRNNTTAQCRRIVVDTDTVRIILIYTASRHTAGMRPLISALVLIMMTNDSRVRAHIML